MKRKETYLSRDFRETAALRFPARAKELNTAFDMENPNEAVRAFCKPFNEVGIKTHMLDRGLNALRMYPVPDDVRAMMYRVKHAQGVDIPRIFDGLNASRKMRFSMGRMDSRLANTTTAPPTIYSDAMIGTTFWAVSARRFNPPPMIKII